MGQYKNKVTYIREIKKVFPLNGIAERKYLKSLINRVNEIYIEYPKSSYDDFVERIGEPKELAYSYYDNLDISAILAKIKYKKLIKNSMIIISIMIILLVSLTLIKSYYDGKNGYIHSEHVELIED